MQLIFIKQFVACALALILGPEILLATDTPALKKVRIGIPGGVTCNAPLFVAYEKNFFKEEGLDAELIRGDWDFIKESLALGKIGDFSRLAWWVHSGWTSNGTSSGRFIPWPN
jgi:ABC-type nitrate/sulfonate/bicarbonate transport system substrate-binding protein